MKNRTALKLKAIITTLVMYCFSLGINAQLTSRIDSLAQAYHIKGFNGNILYSKNDSIIFTGNYGYADISSSRQLNDTTIFELASVSKQFTALAIVQLVEQNRLEYHTNVHQILDGFPYESITVEHLLRHQSGLPDYQKLLYDKKHWNRKNQAANKDVLALLTKVKPALLFLPGSRYEYDNTGYALLALIIEQVSGKSYQTYIEEHIFIPAKMVHAKVYTTSQKAKSFKNVAHGYTFNTKKKRLESIEKNKSHKHIHWMNHIVGDRGIYASILDLENWKRALRNNTLISAQSKEQMFSTDSISTKYGYGFAIYKTEKKGKWVYHNGSWSGYKTTAIYLPRTNEYLVILSNNRYEQTYKKFEDDFYAIIQ
ncbi:MAG: serine hydrolase domain-containing protein [Gilvibacter sp.]